MVRRRINRYELKYVIHATKYPYMVEDLRNFVVPDAYGDSDGFYRITSLYADSPSLQCYRAKVDGLDIRRKVRLRVYPGDDPTKLKTGCVEIKQRLFRTVQKQRVFLPLSEAEALMAGEVPACITNPQDLAAARNIQFLVRAMALRPVCIVSYRRQAFMGGRYESGMRVTFDMDLSGRIHALQVNEDARNHHFMPLDWLVMEVKVDERIPGWMTSLLAKHECVLTRVSKYCMALADGMRRRAESLQHKENIYG